MEILDNQDYDISLRENSIEKDAFSFLRKRKIESNALKFEALQTFQSSSCF